MGNFADAPVVWRVVQVLSLVSRFSSFSQQPVGTFHALILFEQPEQPRQTVPYLPVPTSFAAHAHPSSRTRLEMFPLDQREDVVRLLTSRFSIDIVAKLPLLSKSFHATAQSVLETEWLKALYALIKAGTDPVGKHAPSPGFPLSVFTTVNNLPKSRGVFELLLPPKLYGHIDDIIRGLGRRNLLKTKYAGQYTIELEAQESLEALITLQQEQPDIQMNLLVEGCFWDQLLQNGMRPSLLVAATSNAPHFDALGVLYGLTRRPDDEDYATKVVRPAMLQETSSGAHVRRVLLMQRQADIQPYVQPGEQPTCCLGNLCIRSNERHRKVRCVPPRDVKEDGTVVGCLGVACVGHMSAAKTLGLSDAYLNESTALAVRRLLLGVMMQEELVVYI